MADIASDIWAKSPFGDQEQGESFDHHSRQLIHKFMELHRRTPMLAAWLGEPRFWHRVFWSCFLHDFGKVADGFQKQLQGKALWGQRHEILSLAFLPWVLDRNGPDYAWVAAAIASHHRDSGLKYDGSSGGKYTIFELYNTNDERTLERNLNLMLKGEDGEAITQPKLEGLAKIIQVRVPELFKEYQLDKLGVELNLNLSDSINLAQFLDEAPNTIFDALLCYRELINDTLEPELRQRDIIEHKLNRQAVALRGMLLLSDRLASSYAWEIEPAELPDRTTLFTRRKLPLTSERPDIHQRKAAEVKGSLVMDAPTGSGKTEAALLWARKQQEETNLRPNLVYILPFQASMNSMRDRLAESLFDVKVDKRANELKVALMHGRSTQVMYKQMLSPGGDPKDAERLAKRAKSMAGLYQPSVWVATPYQLLKAAYRLPGYEMLWTAIAGSRLIIDEIHAYEPRRLGLLIELLAYVKNHWNCEICVMTATMPRWLRRILVESLQIPPENLLSKDKLSEPDTISKKSLFEYFQRHRLEQLEGKLTDATVLDHITQQFGEGKMVLVCANTVKGANKTLNALRQRLQAQGFDPSEKAMLLHSRFTGKDRLDKETKIVNVAKAGRAKKAEDALIVVATQVIEVSLDLDFDTIVTEPAPLEALAQRFGRVNRRGKAGQPLATVWVLTDNTNENVTPDKKYMPYEPAALVENTLKIVERERDKVIDEALLSDWLDEIYQAGNLEAEFVEQVQEGQKHLRQDCVSQLRAFDSDESLEEAFDKLFNGIEVLPKSKLDDYKEAFEKESALAASVYLVPISFGQYQAHKNKISTETITKEGENSAKITVTVIDLPYNSDTGLQLQKQEEDGL